MYIYIYIYIYTTNVYPCESNLALFALMRCAMFSGHEVVSYRGHTRGTVTRNVRKVNA